MSAAVQDFLNRVIKNSSTTAATAYEKQTRQSLLQLCEYVDALKEDVRTAHTMAVSAHGRLGEISRQMEAPALSSPERCSNKPLSEDVCYQVEHKIVMSVIDALHTAEWRAKELSKVVTSHPNFLDSDGKTLTLAGKRLMDAYFDDAEKAALLQAALRTISGQAGQ